MKTLQSHDGKYYVPLSGANGAQPEVLLARERIALIRSRPDGSDEMDLDQFITDVGALGQEIKSQLVAMDEEVDLALVSLLAGENVFFLSLPGAAKTTLARMIAKGIDGNFLLLPL